MAAFMPAHRARYMADLLRELVVRDIKVRYKRSFIGLGWSLLNPVVQLVVLYVFFTRLMPLRIPDYTVFLFTGILVWNWFQSALHSCASVIVDNAAVLRQPGFPVPVLPLASVVSSMVHFLLAVPVLLVAAFVTGHPGSPALIALPAIMLVQVALSAGIGYFLAALQVPYRDTQHLLGIALMLGFYFAPVFYDSSSVPAAYRALYGLNPMVRLIDAYRAVVLHGRFPDPLPLAMILGASALLMMAGLLWFRRATYQFAEEV